MGMINSFITSEVTVANVCKILMNRGNKKVRWKEMSSLIRGVEPSQAENLRRGVLGYLGAVLLNNGSIEIADKMEFFKDNYYDSGKAGLIQSCFYAINLEE
jgi:hypothetical protein